MVTVVFPKYSFSDRPRVIVSNRVTEPADVTPTVVALTGELDAAALSSLLQTFDDAIARDDSDVVVDLAEVQFIGAAWIGTLVRSRARLQAQDRELTVRSPSRVVNRLLDLCGLSYLVEPIDGAEPSGRQRDAVVSSRRRLR
jgi:anti-anti-sigma factor